MPATSPSCSSALSQADTSLKSITDEIQRAHELAVKANSGTLSATDRSVIAERAQFDRQGADRPRQRQGFARQLDLRGGRRSRRHRQSRRQLHLRHRRPDRDPDRRFVERRAGRGRIAAVRRCERRQRPGGHFGAFRRLARHRRRRRDRRRDRRQTDRVEQPGCRACKARSARARNASISNRRG